MMTSVVKYFIGYVPQDRFPNGKGNEPKEIMNTNFIPFTQKK
jgi:hypothetical protein